MKKQLITGVATLGLALGAFGQGGVVLDTTSQNNSGLGGAEVFGVTTGTAIGPGGYLYYGIDNPGTLGFQIWYLNGTGSATRTAINNLSHSGNGQGAYDALTTDGYTLATTITGVSGIQALLGQIGGQLNIPGVSPAGGGIELAIAAWTGNGASFGAQGTGDLGYHANGKAYGGVYVFDQTTANYNAKPAPTAPQLAIDGDVTLTPLVVPEPATFALAGLGAAALLIFRRRK